MLGWLLIFQLLGPDAELLGWLAAEKRIGPEADADRLIEVLRDGEIVYLDGGSRSTAARFGALLLDPAFARLAGTPPYDNVRYHLAGALARQGAFDRSRRLLLDLVVRKPPSDFRAPAFRKLVGLALRSGQIEPTLSALKELRFDANRDEKDELAYLEAKALMLKGAANAAAAALSSISRTSRLYAAATYLAGVLAVEQGRSDQAEDLFCRLVRQPGQGRYTFFVSDNAARVVEHAWLALARLRHDRGQYDRAIETYLRIPKDSPVADEARYEASWSLYRAGDLAAARQLLRELLASPAALALPDRPAARLLLGYALIGDCLFDQATELFDDLARRLSALAAAVTDQRSGTTFLPPEVLPWTPYRRAEAGLVGLCRRIDAAIERAAWLRGELDRVASGMPRMPLARPGQGLAGRLGRDLSRAQYLALRMADLRARLGTAENEQSKLEELHRLQDQVAAADARARAALARLGSGRLPAPGTSPAAGRKVPGSYLDAERGRLEKLRQRLSSQQRTAFDMRRRVERSRARRAGVRIAAWARQAMLGRVDAVLGRKQALETEVQNLALGRYPLSLLRELAEAGMLHESNEYWPFDGEHWPDEYE